MAPCHPTYAVMVLQALNALLGLEDRERLGVASESVQAWVGLHWKLPRGWRKRVLNALERLAGGRHPAIKRCEDGGWHLLAPPPETNSAVSYRTAEPRTPTAGSTPQRPKRQRASPGAERWRELTLVDLPQTAVREEGEEATVESKPVSPPRHSGLVSFDKFMGMRFGSGRTEILFCVGRR